MNQVILNVDIKDIDFDIENLTDYKKELISENDIYKKYKLYYIPQNSPIDIKESFFSEKEKIEIDRYDIKIAGILFLSNVDENGKCFYKVLERDDLLVDCQPIEGPTFIRILNVSLTHANTPSCIKYFDKDEMQNKVIKRKVFEEKLSFYIDFSNNTAHFRSNAQLEKTLNEKDIIGTSICGIILELDITNE